MKGRGKGSGVPIDQPFANILDFRGGRIWRSRVYLDRAEGFRFAGLSEIAGHASVEGAANPGVLESSCRPRSCGSPRADY